MNTQDKNQIQESKLTLFEKIDEGFQLSPFIFLPWGMSLSSFEKLLMEHNLEDVAKTRHFIGPGLMGEKTETAFTFKKKWKFFGEHLLSAVSIKNCMLISDYVEVRNLIEKKFDNPTGMGRDYYLEWKRNRIIVSLDIFEVWFVPFQELVITYIGPSFLKKLILTTKSLLEYKQPDS